MTEHRIEILDDPDVDRPLSGDVGWRCSCGEEFSGGGITDAARTAAAHQIGDTQLTQLLGIDPDNDVPGSVDDYIVGVPVLAEEARQADPAAWAWLTQVHQTLAQQEVDPIWPVLPLAAAGGSDR